MKVTIKLKQGRCMTIKLQHCVELICELISSSGWFLEQLWLSDFLLKLLYIELLNITEVVCKQLTWWATFDREQPRDEVVIVHFMSCADRYLLESMHSATGKDDFEKTASSQRTPCRWFPAKTADQGRHPGYRWGSWHHRSRWIGQRLCPARCHKITVLDSYRRVQSCGIVSMDGLFCG